MIIFLHKPILIEKDITLRPFEKKDAKRMYEIINIPEVLYLTGSVESSEETIKSDISIKQIEDWYGSLSYADNRLDLAIEYRGKVIGEVVLNDYNEDESEINFRVLMDTEYTSKGIGFIAISMFLDYACKNLDIKKIVLGVYEFNERAKYVYEKIGFTFQYREKNALNFNNKSYAMDHYEMINPYYS